MDRVLLLRSVEHRAVLRCDSTWPHLVHCSLMISVSFQLMCGKFRMLYFLQFNFYLEPLFVQHYSGYPCCVKCCRKLVYNIVKLSCETKLDHVADIPQH